MVPHQRKPLVWICQRSHWWNRFRHTYLIGSIGLMPEMDSAAQSEIDFPQRRAS
jgi:hypothetical protein